MCFYGKFYLDSMNDLEFHIKNISKKHFVGFMYVDKSNVNNPQMVIFVGLQIITIICTMAFQLAKNNISSLNNNKKILFW